MTGVLNCRTIDTARASVADVLGMSVADLLQRLRRIEVPLSEEPREYISAKLLGVGIDGLPSPSRAHWFHASRVLDVESFRREGLLPKSAMRDRILTLLRELQNGIADEGDYPNGGSVMAKGFINDEGPFGFLLRSQAASAETHFFRAPESVEDIAGSLVGGNFLQLVDRFQQRTTPCLVEFTGPCSSYYVAHALWYVHLVEHGLDESDAADCAGTCFDGEGNLVAAANVVAVECLPPETGRLSSGEHR
jgi:hypothetical protein